jgi:hypothetical protein
MSSADRGNLCRCAMQNEPCSSDQYNDWSKLERSGAPTVLAPLPVPYRNRNWSGASSTVGEATGAEWSEGLLNDVPSTWNGPHVGRRLCEAMRTLALLPMGGGGGSSAWPAYCYEWEDLLAQHEQGELERTQQLQNRIRLLPSSREVQRMEAAICWPAEYLARLTHLLRAVNAVALAHSLDRDAGWIAAKRGGYSDTWRERHDHGCDIIARGLRSCRVPVF